MKPDSPKEKKPVFDATGLEPGDVINFTYKPLFGKEKGYECQVVSVGKKYIEADVLKQDPTPIFQPFFDKIKRFSLKRMRPVYDSENNDIPGIFLGDQS